ncbi:MAG: PAS domain S-box protein [Opitutaceae bacterium]|nr:PAS domain S-box protein [Opitutaceae bacterium]
MAQPLQLLIVEDSVSDTELLVRELVRAGFAPEWKRVDTEAQFLEHLHAGLDLVLSDYAMPQFNGLRALELLRASGLVIPFILVSGTIGEELAVSAMKQGATDYLLKDRLARLGPAVAHALGEAKLQRERHKAEEAKARMEFQLKLLETGVARLNDIFLVTEAEPHDEPGPRILFVNDAFVRRTGYSRAEVLGRSPRFLQGPKTSRAELDRIRAAMSRWEPVRAELINYTKGGEEFWVEIDMAPVADAKGWFTHWVAIERDITERKLAEQRLARVSRLYVVLSRINEMIVRTAEATPLFAGVCRIAVEHGRFRLAAIFGLDAATGEARPLAYFGAELGYFSEMRVNLADPHLNQGTIGTAIRTGRYDVCNDFAHEARMAAWQAPLAQRGYRSGASFPIRQGQEIFGALVLFSEETEVFQEEEIQLLVAVADNLSFALGAIDREVKRQRAEAALRESEVSMATAQQIAHLGSWELDITDEKIDANPLRWSDEMFRIAGLAPGVVRVTNDLFFSLVPPEEHEPIRRAVAAAIREHGQYAIVHHLIRPDGTTRVVEEMAQVKYDGQTGRPVKLIGTAHDITERRLAETERDRLFNLSLDLLCVASFDGRFEQVNPAWTACLGWTAEELTARPMSEFILPDDHETTARIRARVQQGEQIRGLENRYRAKDGSYRWLSWSVHPLVESRRVFAVARDVTERKRTEDALRASEERLRFVTDNARVGLMMIDSERRYTFANATYAEMLGLPSQDIVGRRVAEVLPLLYETQIRERLDRAFAGERMAYELAWPTVGEPRHYIARYEPTKVDGAVALVVVVITDITTRKHAEEALRASVEVQRKLGAQLERERARLIMAQEVAKVGSWETDLATLAVTWSAETFRIFEIDPQLFAATHAGFLEFVHPEDRAAVDAAFVASLDQPGPSALEHRILLAGGRTKFVEERWVVVRDERGNPLRCLGTCQDITPRKRTEAVLRETAEQLRALAARVQAVREEERTRIAREIHDVLAQELTRLKIDLVWVAKRLGQPLAPTGQAAVAGRVGEALGQVDASITTVQRIATDLRPVILDSLGLPAAVEWMTEDFARRTGLVCHASVESGPAALERERATAVFRILQESLTNVARSAQASEVLVELSEAEGVVTLKVADNGVGITREQAEDPRSIGLLGMKERAHAFGGTLEITGRPGAGTTVVARLSIAPGGLP